MTAQDRRDWARWVAQHRGTLGTVPGDQGWNDRAARDNQAEADSAGQRGGRHRAGRGQR